MMGQKLVWKMFWSSFGITLHLSFMLVRGFCEAVWETELDEMSKVMIVNFHI